MLNEIEVIIIQETITQQQMSSENIYYSVKLHIPEIYHLRKLRIIKYNANYTLAT